MGTKNKNKVKVEVPTRVFTGMLDGWDQDKKLRNKEKKRLKSYLRGDSFFSYGVDINKKPMLYKV